MITALRAPALAEVREARSRIASAVVRTPLVRLNQSSSQREIWLKLENMQEIGSFKIRGAANALRSLGPEQLREGVYTASAGNMAQGVALGARQLGVPCTVVVPDSAPQTKLDAITRLGAQIVSIPYEQWWQVMLNHHFDGARGKFVHPVSNADVIAGNASIALEIAEDLPSVNTVVVPYGGGGLSCGIAAAMREVAPRSRVVPVEADTAAPLTASLAAGAAVTVEARRSFVDGIGAKGVLPEMWPLVSSLFAEAVVVSLDEIARAIQLVAERNHVIAEGAGGASVAAALSGRAGDGVIVCVVSGGNINSTYLQQILAGNTP